VVAGRRAIIAAYSMQFFGRCGPARALVRPAGGVWQLEFDLSARNYPATSRWLFKVCLVRLEGRLGEIGLGTCDCGKMLLNTGKIGHEGSFVDNSM
jgi:hypothetical protein